ncbi:unnamed protein product [Effrenium voratum]|nr:unnamed protein product [Effrenium voratum]
MILGQLARQNLSLAGIPGAMNTTVDPRWEVADGQLELLYSAGTWTMVWLCLFYLISVTFPWWISQVQPSTKPHENDRYWCSRDLFGLVHAVIISALSLPPLFLLLFAGEHVKFASSPHLATCEVDRGINPELVDWELTMQAVSVAGLAFTTFTLADLVILMIHGLATADYVAHHVAFLCAGCILRGHCMLPFNAAVLMAMEVSTPFLNWVMFFRHRGEQYQSQVIFCGVVFFLTFLVFRLGLNLFGTILLVVDEARGLAMPENVPEWQQITVIFAIIAGAIVQLYWLPKIWKMFGVRIWQYAATGHANTGDEEPEDSDSESTTK